MEEKEHILNILRKVKVALREKNCFKIKDLSNQVVHNSSINQDADVIFIAVIIYSLSKLIEREHYKKYANWQNFYKNYINAIDKAIKALEKDDLKRFHDEISFIISLIQKLSGNLKVYIQDVFRKAQINKASRIYEHGISIEKTAKILGISIWELSEYVGQTGIADINLSVTLPIKERIKIAEESFSMKKYIIFDSGPLINFAINGILPLLKNLKKINL